jgi:long-chain-fatty-acid--CoA ligase ACSBG
MAETTDNKDALIEAMTDAALPIFTTDRRQPVRLAIGKDKAGVAPITVMDVFQKTAKKYASKPAIHQKVLSEGKTADETEWTTWTWKEYEEQVYAFAKALVSLGFEKFDTINIIGFNSPEWFMSNFGAIAAGGIPAGTYTTNLPEACKYVASHSEAKVVVCEGVKQLEKYLEIGNDLPNLKALVMYGPDAVPENVTEKCSVPVYKFDAFLELGKDVETSVIDERIQAQKPNETCTLIYTSGTTGNPKAVMITHDNLTWVTPRVLEEFSWTMTNDDHVVSFLPLSHIAAQMLDMHCAIQTGNQVWFAQPDALRGSIGATLKQVRPTMFFGVPRVWEKIYDKMQEVAKQNTGIKKSISTWAKAQCLRHQQTCQYGGENPACTTISFYPIAHKLISKVHVALGLDRCRAFFTAAAPIEYKVLEYFASIDIPIYEVFGQSECTGPHTVNTYQAWKMGTCGRPIKGSETKIVEENGELCYRGRHIFAGYMGMPDKTAEALDEEGWLHSGDVAVLDDDNDPSITGPSGFMKITGRIKELIITAGGENVPPVLIEEEFKAAMPALANCMLIGDKRKFLSILLCLQVQVNEETGVPSNKLTGAALSTSKEIGSSATTTEEAKTCEKWTEYFNKGMAVANDKATSRAQKVAKWKLLDKDFSVTGGELTPTLKLKRSVAADIHSEAIESIYA